MATRADDDDELGAVLDSASYTAHRLVSNSWRTGEDWGTE